MRESQEAETESWRVLLFARTGAELLVFRTAAGFRLPEVHIPKWQRIVPSLIAEVKRLWRFNTVCLFPFGIGPLEPSGCERKYQVMEFTDPEVLAQAVPDSLVVSDLEERWFADRLDFLAVAKAMRFDGRSFAETSRGPFSEFGSFEKICAWVETELGYSGLYRHGSFRQLQASASASLIRFESDSGAAWFKAVGGPTTREFFITRQLSSRYPSFLPVCIAHRADWNAWLTEEAQGQDLFHCPESAWRRAAASLAEMQISSLPGAADILSCGAHDVRSRALLSVVTPFFEAAGRLMDHQTKAVPAPLRAGEIAEVQEQVVSLLERPGFTSIPDSLNHLDPNPGNIFVSKNRCAFLDWAEAAVGNPFLTFEYLRQHFSRAFPTGDADALFRAYASRWAPVLSHHVAEEAARLAPLVAVFAHAVSNDVWRNPQKMQDPLLAGYFRSLVRRMKTYADHLCAALCETETRA